MKLILLENVINLGNLGDTVTVKSGYGRNFLVPQGKAVRASKDNLAMFEARRAELEAAANERKGIAEGRQEKLQGLTITMVANASDEGKLFGSIGPREIADEVTKTGVELEKSEVIMGEGPIRQIGEHEVPVHLHADVEATITVVVETE